MKTLNLIIASAITLLTISSLNAQNPAQIVKVTVTNNSNMPTQQPTPMTFMFGDGQSDSLAFPDAGDEGTIGQYNDQVFPFSLSADNYVISTLDARSELTGYRAIPLGFLSKNAGEIKIIAETFNTSGDPLNNTVGFAWVEQISTGEKRAILGDTAKFDITANTSFASDFILHTGTMCTPLATEETCFNTSDANIQILSPNYNNFNFELYYNANLMVAGTVTGTDTTISNLSAGSYVSVVRVNGITVDSSDITINPRPAIIADYLADYNYITVGSTVNFTDYSVGGIAYSWNFGDNTSSNTIGNEMHQFDSVGTFNVTLTVTDVYGCTSSVTDIVTADPVPPVHNNNQFNNNGHPSSFNNNTTSANEEGAPTTESNNSTEVYYSNGKLLVDNHESVVAQVNISSLNGTVVYSGTQTESRNEYAVSATGVYVVTIVYANGTSKSWHIAAL